jgi:hypothetical protein
MKLMCREIDNRCRAIVLTELDSKSSTIVWNKVARQVSHKVWDFRGWSP